MSRAMPRVRGVQALGGHRLRLDFDDGAAGEIDFTARLTFEGVMEPLRDPAYFRRVSVDREAGTICWPNGVDFDPDVLYEAATGTEARSPNEALSPTPPDLRSRPSTASPAPAADHRMPEISRFFGIVVRMYHQEHAPPHFQIVYGDHEAVIEIATLSVMRGRFPSRGLGMVVEWASVHRRELQDNWERARRGEPLVSIAPLE